LCKEHFKGEAPLKIKNKVFGIGGEQYHSSTVFSQADMINYQMGYNAYYPFQYFGAPMDNMMYNPNMNPGYYPNMRNPLQMPYMRQ
jgi:hypothetical protein